MSLCLTLQHSDLVCLVRGCSPPFKLMDHPLVKPYFQYYDHPQREEWHGLEKLSDVQLWTLYLVCKPRK